MKTVADVMCRDVQSVPLEATLGTVVHMMAGEQTDYMIVVDQQRTPAGIMTERDPAAIIILDDNWRDLPVKNAMSEPAMCLKETMPIDHAAEIMSHYSYQHYPVVNDAGVLVGFLSPIMLLKAQNKILREAYADQSDRMTLIEKRLEATVTDDDLTRILNRRAFLQALRGEWDRCVRYGSTVSVLLIDIDGLEEINQKHGREAGDTLLAEFASLLSMMLRASDTYGRYGGDEFAVMLPIVSLADAVTVGEKILTAAANHEFTAGDGEARITVSIGCASLPDNDPSIQTEEDLLREADAALCRAKAEGRNCIRCYGA